MRSSVRDTGEIPTIVVMVVEDGSEVVVGRLDARRPDLALVDALARLQLNAGRCGWRLGLRGASVDLRALLELVGLADVLALEAGREPELGEERGVEEMVQSRDAPV
jgi:hypothetical protein